MQTAQHVMDVVAVGLSPPLWLLNPLAIGRLCPHAARSLLTDLSPSSARAPVVDGRADRSSWTAAVAHRLGGHEVQAICSSQGVSGTSPISLSNGMRRRFANSGVIGEGHSEDLVRCNSASRDGSGRRIRAREHDPGHRDARVWRFVVVIFVRTDVLTFLKTAGFDTVCLFAYSLTHVLIAAQHCRPSATQSLSSWR